MKKVFAENLRYYTQLRGNTFTELAESIGVGKSAISNWVNGLSMPRMSKIDLICDFLQISRSDLLECRITDSIRDSILGDFPKNRNEAEKWKDELILEQFHKLNNTGKKKAMSDLEDLTYIEKYTKKED